MNFKALTLSLILSTTLASTQVLGKGTVNISGEDGDITDIKRPVLSYERRVEQAKKRVSKQGFRTCNLGIHINEYGVEATTEYVKGHLYNRDVQDWLLAKGRRISQKYDLETEYNAIVTAYSIVSPLGNYWEDFEEVDLSNRKLSVLPWEFVTCNRNQRLVLNHNSLSYLPDTVKSWRVETLDLRGNPLREAPTALGFCQNLSALYLSPDQAETWGVQVDSSDKVRSLPLLLKKLKKEHKRGKALTTNTPTPQTISEALNLISQLQEEIAEQEKTLVKIGEQRSLDKRGKKDLEDILKGFLGGTTTKLSSNSNGKEVYTPVLQGQQGFPQALEFILLLQRRVALNAMEIERRHKDNYAHKKEANRIGIMHFEIIMPDQYNRENSEEE